MSNVHACWLRAAILLQHSGTNLLLHLLFLSVGSSSCPFPVTHKPWPLCLQALQHQCELQSREHAELVEAHTRLQLQLPVPASTGNISNDLLVRHNGPPHVRCSPTSSSAPQGIEGTLPDVQIAQQQQQQQQDPDAAEEALRARNRLVRELQRFELPTELRQMLMSIPTSSAGGGAAGGVET